MKEIKIVFGKGGKVELLAKGQKGKGTEKFTEKLADELGAVEERHKAGTATKVGTTQQVEQGN
jgi:hypothetical protein